MWVICYHFFKVSNVVDMYTLRGHEYSNNVPALLFQQTLNPLRIGTLAPWLGRNRRRRDTTTNRLLMKS